VHLSWSYCYSEMNWVFWNLNYSVCAPFLVMLLLRNELSFLESKLPSVCNFPGHAATQKWTLCFGIWVTQFVQLFWSCCYSEMNWVFWNLNYTVCAPFLVMLLLRNELSLLESKSVLALQWGGGTAGGHMLIGPNSKSFSKSRGNLYQLNFILLTWTIWWAPNNDSKWHKVLEALGMKSHSLK